VIATPRTLLRTILAFVVLAATVAAVTAPTAAAKEKTPCWKTLINDWYDGRIDRTYEVHCYKEALKQLPADVRTYSDAYDVISRALSDATHGKKDVKESSPVPPPPSNGGGGGSGGSGTGGSGTGGSGSGSGSDLQSDHSGGSVFGQATDRLGSDSADSLPIPLLVLAGLALLLVAAGGAGLLARRVQAKRSGPRS
jgi:cobalamin biosynthesis Mg chelatase CobN